jgi:hypothetical protein
MCAFKYGADLIADIHKTQNPLMNCCGYVCIGFPIG